MTGRSLDRLTRRFLPAPPSHRHPAARTALILFVLVVAAGIVASRATHYAGHPVRLPSSPDSAWYDWRSELLTAAPPGTLVAFAGPTGDGGGGYRVATPLLGALLRRVAGVHVFTVPTLFVVGFNSLLALAIGGAAYRYRRDPLLFASTALWAGWMLFWNPFLGYSDNVLALLLLAAALSFAGDGRRGAIAVAGLAFLAFLAHPPAAIGFAAAVVVASLLRLILDRSLTRTAAADGPVVVGAVGGAVVGYLAWRLGAWGPTATLADAIHPSRTTQQAFADRLHQWLGMLHPWLTIPLIVLGIVALVLTDRSRFRRDLLPRTMVCWSLPVLGVLGVFTSHRYPYHRFLNVTAAPLLLAGVGLWLLVRPFFRTGPSTPRVAASGVVGTAVAAVLLVPVWASGLRGWDTHGSRTGYLRPVTAAIRAYVGTDPDPPPLVFVASTREPGPWSFRRGTSNKLRAGLPGPSITRAYVFVGSVDDFLAGHPTTDVPDLKDVSEGSFQDMTTGVDGREPLVLLIRQWNRELGNRSFFDAPASVQMERDVFVLTGPGLAVPDPFALDRAATAGAAERDVEAGAALDAGRVAHLTRVGLGLLLLGFVPGALACRYFRRTDVVMVLTAAPPLSLALNLTIGFLVLGVVRRPVTPAMAWTIVAMATGMGGALFVLGGRRSPAHGAGREGGERSTDREGAVTP